MVPLNPNKLAGSIIEFTSNPDPPAVSGPRFAAGYASYAATATSCAGASPLPASIAAAKGILGAALIQAFQTSTDPASSTAQLAAAFTAFWLAPPMAFPSVAPGLVTLVPPTLQPALLAHFMKPPPSSNEAAGRAMAKILDTWTKTIVVTHGPTPACISPIT
jgi:hypothetical protein